MKVSRNWGGLHLEAVHGCEKCRRLYRLFVNKVHENSVTLLPVDFKPEEGSWSYD